ncbi:MAG: hypothetical protein AAF757_02970 [Cyanobacteria bacterium P01_D01_bin.116]
MKKLLLATLSVPFFAFFPHTTPVQALDVRQCYRLITDSQSGDAMSRYKFNNTPGLYQKCSFLIWNESRRRRLIQNRNQILRRNERIHRVKLCRNACNLVSNEDYAACLSRCP